MAKIGKGKAAVDPFSVGNRAFGALDEALGSLEREPEKKQESIEERPRSSVRSDAGPPAVDPQKSVQEAAKPIKSKAANAPSSSKQKRARRFLATDEEMLSWQRASMRLGAATGARADFSKITRALWEVYLRHEEDILRNVPEEEWERPSNADTVGLAILDERLAELLNEGLMVASRRPRNVRRQGG